jgi:integrase
MSAKKGHRPWGYIVQLPNKSKRFEASYIGPDKKRHYAPTTYTFERGAEGWLANERAFIERCAMTGEQWTSPKQRAAQLAAESLTLSDYAKTWIEHRNVKPRTRNGYESLCDGVIGPKLGDIPLRMLTPETIRSWYAGLGSDTPRRKSHAYGLLHAILETAFKSELIAKNPCQIERAMNTNRKSEPVLLEPSEIAALADEIGARWRVLVLLSAWCGLRWGEIAELRRSDIGSGCESVTVSRAVNHRSKTCTIDTTKSDKARTVVIPPHIRADVKAHLDTHTKPEPDALLFVPVRGGCHLDNKTFADSYLKPALKSIKRESASHHDLRHFCATMTSRAGGTVAETMARLGHSTAKAAMQYQAAAVERQTVIADALSALATQQLPTQT